MALETIFQHWVVTQFILPFFLIFAIVFAILEKTNLFGEDKKQLNAIVALVIGLVFVGAVFPKLFVENMVLFLTIAVVVVFVGLVLWGFISGSNLKEDILPNKGLKITALIVITLAVLIAVLWASGVENTVFDLLFRSSWSQSFWTNVAFIAVIVIALVVILRGGKSKG